ncbi:Btz domain-containing protein [Citrus sinensis]|uniref:Btz domain-containing protein n=1 Tax=Citrus sinensis TaxID=2711 RepID=A0ACB8NT00_CITSI|nr:Btz domain-containing protein [Citrus sinensis]
MANLGEKQKVEETEYESESEESVYAVATRRENASDDDDDGNGNSEGEARERLVRTDRKVRVGYGDEWDGLGGWDENDVDAVDELEVLGDEQLEVLKKLVEVEEEDEEKEDFGEKEVYAGEKQRKEKESKAPLDPRNGAFYMHDDRFRGRGRGSSRSKKFVKGASNSVSVRASSKMKNVESCFLASEKHGFKENNCSALQMLNPSSPSKHLNSVTEKIDVKPGKAFEHFPTCALQNQDSFVPRCNSLVQGRIPNNPIGQDKFFSENFIHPASESYLTNLPPQPSIIWPTYTVASPQMMGPRDLFFSIMLSHQLSLPINQVSSVYPPAQQPIVQHIPIESMIRHPSLVYTQQLNQSSGSGAQASSEALLPNSYDIDKPGSLATTSKSKVALGGKGVSTCHGNGRGSFLSRVTQSNRNFTDNAALLPAMQLGSQQNGDHDEPAIKVAVTRYLSQSQNAFGNPEITWFPVFPAATGTVGSADSSLHAAAKGGYTAHSTGELSSYRVTSLVTVAWQCDIIQDTLGEAGVRLVNFTSKVVRNRNKCFQNDTELYG